MLSVTVNRNSNNHSLQFFRTMRHTSQSDSLSSIGLGSVGLFLIRLQESFGKIRIGKKLDEPTRVQSR